MLLFLIIVTDKFPDPRVLPSSRLPGMGRRLTYGEPINSTGSASTQPAAKTLDIDEPDQDEAEGILILSIISTKTKIDVYDRFQQCNLQTAKCPTSAIL